MARYDTRHTIRVDPAPGSGSPLFLCLRSGKNGDPCLVKELVSLREQQAVAAKRISVLRDQIIDEMEQCGQRGIKWKNKKIVVKRQRAYKRMPRTQYYGCVRTILTDAKLLTSADVEKIGDRAHH